MGFAPNCVSCWISTRPSIPVAALTGRTWPPIDGVNVNNSICPQFPFREGGFRGQRRRRRREGGREGGGFSSCLISLPLAWVIRFRELAILKGWVYFLPHLSKYPPWGRGLEHGRVAGLIVWKTKWYIYLYSTAIRPCIGVSPPAFEAIWFDRHLWTTFDWIDFYCIELPTPWSLTRDVADDSTSIGSEFESSVDYFSWIFWIDTRRPGVRKLISGVSVSCFRFQLSKENTG